MSELVIEQNQLLMDLLTKKADERNTTILNVIEDYVREYRCRYLRY